MMAWKVFVSHASADKPFVIELQQRLASYGVDAWVDARELIAGDALQPEIEKAIESSDGVLAVLSLKTLNSAWVTREIKHALSIQKTRGAEYKIISLLRDGIQPAALQLWFGSEPLAVIVEDVAGGLDKAMPQIAAALGLQLPTYIPQSVLTPPAPLADLILKLS